MRVRINRLRYIHDPLWCCSLDIIGGLYPYNPSIFHRRNPGIIQSKWDKILLRVYPSSQRFFAGRKFHVLFAKTKAPRVLNNTQNYPTTLTLLSVLSSGKLTKSDGKSPSLIGKSTIYIHINGPFSIAMLNYQRICIPWPFSTPRPTIAACRCSAWPWQIEPLQTWAMLRVFCYPQGILQMWGFPLSSWITWGVRSFRVLSCVSYRGIQEQ